MNSYRYYILPYLFLSIFPPYNGNKFIKGNKNNKKSGRFIIYHS